MTVVVIEKYDEKRIKGVCRERERERKCAQDFLWKGENHPYMGVVVMLV
jgi:hypothetical protein